MLTALISPRIASATLAPGWPAMERVLYLAALDRCLRSSATDRSDVRAAYRDLRRVIDVRAPTLYAQTPVDGAAESRWIIAARDAVADGSATERAAVLVWAAVAAWTDAPQGAWGALADAGSALAEALDAEVLDGGHPAETGRVAGKLRAVMADGWREMGDGR